MAQPRVQRVDAAAADGLVLPRGRGPDARLDDLLPAADDLARAHERGHHAAALVDVQDVGVVLQPLQGRPRARGARGARGAAQAAQTARRRGRQRLVLPPRREVRRLLLLQHVLHPACQWAWTRGRTSKLLECSAAAARSPGVLCGPGEHGAHPREAPRGACTRARARLGFLERAAAAAGSLAGGF